MKKIILSTVLCLITCLAMSQYVQGTIVQNSSNAKAVDIYGESSAAFSYPLKEFDFVVSVPSSAATNATTATATSTILPSSGSWTPTAVSTVGTRTYYAFQYTNNQPSNTTPVNFVANVPLQLASVTFTGLTGQNTYRLTDENSNSRSAVYYWYIAAIGTAGQDQSGEISADPTKGQQVYYANTGQSTTGGSGMVQYVGTSSTSVLPITLVNFTAIKSLGKVDMAWATATEVNAASFMVQRSSNGIDFTPVVTVAAIGSGANSYAAIDASPLTGTSFYRLKNIDKDGSFAYSNIVSLNFTAGNNVSVYPSPAQSYINVNVSSTTLYGTVANLVDFGGRTIQSFTIIGNLQQINISNLAAGIYIVKLIDGTFVKFIKG